MKFIQSFTFLLVAVGMKPLIGQQAQPAPSYTAPSVQHSVGSATVTADDPRPLWMALNALEQEYGWLIDYEDPIYQVSDTTVFAVDPRWQATHPGIHYRIPAGQHFSSLYAEDRNLFNSTPTHPEVIDRILADYAATGNPGIFQRRIDSPGRVRVVGFSQAQPDRSSNVLDTTITLPTGTMNAFDALDALTSAVSTASGIKIGIATVPFNLLSGLCVTIPASPVPARVVLTSIGDSPTRKLMWSLLYDFQSQMYFLNLAPQLKVVADVQGNRVPYCPLSNFVPQKAK